VVSGKSGLVPLEVIKAKAALHVSDWELDEVFSSKHPFRLAFPCKRRQTKSTNAYHACTHGAQTKNSHMHTKNTKSSS